MHRFWVSLLLAGICAAQPADWIVSARYVVPIVGPQRVIENGAVAVRGSRIIAVGKKAELEKRHPSARKLDRPDAIIAPGLINAHTHAPMVLMRGIADDLRLQDWLEKFIFPAEGKNVSADFVRWGTRLACAEMMLGGITTYADMYYFEEVIAEATREAGMRGLLGQTIIDFPVPDAKTPADALARTEAFIKRFKDDPLITPAPAPHAIFTNSDETLRSARSLANRYNVPLLIHLSETKRENEETQAKRKATPTRALNALGVLDGRTLAAHAVWVDEADMQILKSKKVGIAHCPSSNMKLASGIAPVVRFLELDLAAGLGTDGPAGSNNDLNLFEEMDLAAKLQKVATGDPKALPAPAALRMATLGGARAIGLEKEIGSLEPGKRADLIVVRLNQPHAAPLFDIESQLVYALKASDVSDVMIEGRFVVRDRHLLTIDLPQVLSKASEYGSRIRQHVGTK